MSSSAVVGVARHLRRQISACCTRKVTFSVTPATCSTFRCSQPLATFSTTHRTFNETSLAQASNLRQDRLFEKVDIEIRAHQPDVLKSYSWFATIAAKELDIIVSESWAEPEPHMVRKSLLKAAFANGKHKVQYEIRTYYHFIQVSKLTESTMNTFLEYIQRNLPEGVAMKVTKHERKQLPDHILKTILSEPPLEEQ